MKAKNLLFKMTVRLGMFSILMAMVLCSNFTYSQCTGINSVQDPALFSWTYHPVTANNPVAYYSGVMEVGQASFVMNNGQTLTTRAYRQQGGNYSIPGPTIKVIRGNKYVLQFHNTLPYSPLSTSINVYKDPNASNIHTHGLHISGQSPGDDVMRAFEGGRGGDFVWDIPADHMGGTYWYHAHHHGSSFLQISGGLFGLLIVDDAGDGIPANVAAMPEKHLVVGYLDPGAAGTGGDVLLSGTLTPTWTVNGVIGGNICMPANSWQHWRILVADRNANMETISWGPECEVMLLARDGVWRTVTPFNLSSKSINLTGASRADIAVRTTGNSTFKINGNLLANIIASGTPNTTPHPFAPDGISMWSALRPYYLRDLRGLTPVSNQSISMGARTINGSKFNEHVPTFTLTPNSIQEWNFSGAVQHPFHIHTYHLQPQTATQNFEAGEFYDVLAANVNARFDFNAATSSSVYSGMAIMHCHVLAHEDQGAMGWMNVVGGEGPPTFPADGDLANPYSVYYILGGGIPPSAPSGLSATAVSSSSINLAWTVNSSNETGFNIERSGDGIIFNALASVGANVMTYTDNGLTASTPYYYRVIAYNAYGNSSPSNVANATTQSGGAGTVMHVESLTVTRATLSGGKRRGVATVRIFNDLGAAVSGAAVTGTFTGPTTGTVSGTTDPNGQVIMNSAAIKNPIGEWCYEVTNVTKSGYTYASSANLVTKACEGGPVFRTASESVEYFQANCCELSVFPNPFDATTFISWVIPEQRDVRVAIYDGLGKEITVIIHNTLPAGRTSVEFNAGDIPNGIYFCRLWAGDFTQTVKLLLQR